MQALCPEETVPHASSGHEDCRLWAERRTQEMQGLLPHLAPETRAKCTQLSTRCQNLGT